MAIDVVLLSVVTAIPEALSVGKLVVDQEHPPFKDVSRGGQSSSTRSCKYFPAGFRGNSNVCDS